MDFSALARAGDVSGLDRVGFTTQAWFLLGCGLTCLLAELAEDGGGARGDSADGGHRGGDARYAAHAHAVRQLTLPGEMGERIRVLGLGRALGEGAAAFRGFSGRRLDDRL